MKFSKYLLLKIAEEAAEVSKEALKTAMFGYTSGEYDNLKRLVTEIQELDTVIGMLNDEVGEDTTIGAVMSAQEAQEIYERKKERILYYYGKLEEHADLQEG